MTTNQTTTDDQKRNAQHAESAQQYAERFNREAYRIRGWCPDPRPPDQVRQDVSRSVEARQDLYSDGFANGVDPTVVARHITDWWWDRDGLP